MSERWKLIALGVAIVLLAGGCAGILVYVEQYDANVKKRVTTALREVPMGSSPVVMRERLGDPDGFDIRPIHGQRAYCLGWTIAVFGDEDLRWACYVHGRRVR
jgi:hypothetical protein